MVRRRMGLFENVLVFFLVFSAAMEERERERGGLAIEDFDLLCFALRFFMGGKKGHK